MKERIKILHNKLKRATKDNADKRKDSGVGYVIKLASDLAIMAATEATRPGINSNQFLIDLKAYFKQGYDELQPIEGIIPFDHCEIVPSSKLIQDYEALDGTHLTVRNWFNCSVTEFNGKTYMVYRMDMYPHIYNTRCGMCEMEWNGKEWNPIRNAMLQLPTYSKGYGAEDPRFFIYNGELYLNYAIFSAQNFQMGYAKLDPVTMKASEGTILEKPNIMRQEKNWAFFEYEGELYCVYDPQPDHVIFKIHGKRIEKVHKTRFSYPYKYGEVRGGASPILHDGYYYHFFHGVVKHHYGGTGKGWKEYTIGLYLFDSKPPFTPTYICPIPLFAAEPYDTEHSRISPENIAAFVCGAMRKDDGWLLSFGHNNIECGTVWISDDTIKSNLTKM